MKHVLLQDLERLCLEMEEELDDKEIASASVVLHTLCSSLMLGQAQEMARHMQPYLTELGSVIRAAKLREIASKN